MHGPCLALWESCSIHRHVPATEMRKLKFPMSQPSWYAPCHFSQERRDGWQARASLSKERDVKYSKKKEQPGDILGISKVGGPKLPHPPSDGSVPEGIDVRGERTRHWGIEDIPQSDGAAGIDMGSGGGLVVD